MGGARITRAEPALPRRWLREGLARSEVVNVQAIL
jgi:hypothetical protein